MDPRRADSPDSQTNCGSASAARLAEAFAAEPELIQACLEGAGALEPGILHQILAAVREGVDRRPKFADLLYHAAQAALSTGDAITAGALVDQALAANPEYRDALLLGARVAIHCSEWTRAGDYLDRALAAGANFPDVHLLCGEVATQRGDTQAARMAYVRALELNPGLAEARAILAALNFPVPRDTP